MWKIHLARGRWQAAELKAAEIATMRETQRAEQQAEEARTSVLEDEKRERGAHLRGVLARVFARLCNSAIIDARRCGGREVTREVTREGGRRARAAPWRAVATRASLPP